MSEETMEVVEATSELDSEQKNVAIEILEMEEEADALALQIKTKRVALLDAMLKAEIKSIKTKFGTFMAIEKKNIKVDKKAAEIYLDSIGEKEHYMKLDDTKVKKVFHNPESNTTHNFIKVQEPTVYLSIKKEKM